MTCNRSTEEFDVTHRASLRALFAHDMPGFERVTQLQSHAVMRHRADDREAELPLRLKPFRLEGVAGPLEIAEHVGEIFPNIMGQHEFVVQRGSPAHEPAFTRLAPEPGGERPQQQLLGETHAGVRRHLESAKFDQAEAPGRAVRGIELVDADFRAMGVAGNVDQQIAEQPVHQPERKVAGPGAGVLASAISIS